MWTGSYFMKAATNNHIEILKMLLPHVKVYSIKSVLHNFRGNFRTLKFLIDLPNIEVNGLIGTASRGVVIDKPIEDIFKFLLSHEKLKLPNDLDKEAIIDLVYMGDYKGIMVLLSDGRIDPTTNNNKALNNAIKYSKLKAAETLLTDKRVYNSSEYKNPYILYKKMFLTLDVRARKEFIENSKDPSRIMTMNILERLRDAEEISQKYAAYSNDTNEITQIFQKLDNIKSIERSLRSQLHQYR